MALYKLTGIRGAGRGKKLASIVASITGTGDITTGLNSIDAAVPSVQNADALGSDASQEFATITAISGGTVSVSVIEVGTTPAIAQATAAKNVGVLAVGE